jgi:hypothetical protein
MPNCIELDGYCTGSEDEEMEESEDDDDETSTSKNIQVDDKSECDNKHWWRKECLYGLASHSPIHCQENGTHQSKQSKQLQKEQRRLNQLRNCQSALDRHCVSGYLLKRSHKDKNVWRRVHCVLTDDYLWFVSRLHTVAGGIRIAKHGRVGLHRALLLEATADYAPLFQTPHAFQVVSQSGISHVFRASNQALQQRWIQCLADRIVTCHENKILQHAELIVQDEALAHNKRLSTVAIEPLMSHANDNEEMRMNVLRWGMDVADYREQCRHVQLRMPAKRPVVVVTQDGNPSNPSPRRLFASPNGSGNGELDPDTRDMIRSAWDSAAVLLARATTYLARKDKHGKMSNSLETLCRHADYVITGRFRPLNETGEAAIDQMDRSYDPPPADLFDALLAELQSGCRSNRNSVKTNGHAIETPLGKR